MQTFIAGGKTISVFPGAGPGAPAVYLNTFAGEGQHVYEAMQRLGCPACTLVAIGGLDWSHDMAPWDCPPAFKQAEPCTGGADAYLQSLVDEILPAVEGALPAAPRWRGLVGYSLAGLFALYALCRTDVFSRAGSVSGSLWFPKIKGYLLSHMPKRQPDCIYLSLGEREDRIRAPLLKDIRQDTQEIGAFYQSMGIDTVFRLRPGGHHDHAAEHTAAGIAWLLGR